MVRRRGCHDLYFWKGCSQVSGKSSGRLKCHYVIGTPKQARSPRPEPCPDVDGGATLADEVVNPIKLGLDARIHRPDRRAHHTIWEQPGYARTKPRCECRAALHAPTLIYSSVRIVR
jgi:hypothetical protein